MATALTHLAFDFPDLPNLMDLPPLEVVAPVSRVETKAEIAEDFVLLLPMARSLPLDREVYIEAPYPNYIPYNLFVVRTWMTPILQKAFPPGQVPEVVFIHTVFQGLMRVAITLQLGYEVVPIPRSLIADIDTQLNKAREYGYRGALLPGGKVEDLNALGKQTEESYIDIFNAKITA